MAIVLPEGHPRGELGVRPRDADGRRLRIGIVNIMPRLEEYEPSLLEPLSLTAELVEPVFLRLSSHGYQSSDQGHLARYYQSFETAITEAPLDGLILTGAPVEELPFEAVRYWRELEELLVYARSHVTATLGLCWGALALGRVLGIEKRLFARKLFGVFEDQLLVPEHDVLRVGHSFACPHSRHSGVIEAELEGAARDGVVRLLSRGDETGYSVFETPDRRYLAHVGHPEYDGARLAFEWNRDRALGRTDVEPPAHFDADAPHTTWRLHRTSVFSGLVERAARGGG